MRSGVTAVLSVLTSAALLAVAPAGAAPLPDRMADTGGGSQLITAVSPGVGRCAVSAHAAPPPTCC
ncbi:hypothetical protein [Streptomyces sp. KR55]|uniref:hypothetical protein n=1 Tax=Streptomyces sp. KR55 TaxID=3457425 RepID=UPI003FD4755E